MGESAFALGQTQHGLTYTYQEDGLYANTNDGSYRLTMQPMQVIATWATVSRSGDERGGVVVEHGADKKELWIDFDITTSPVKLMTYLRRENIPVLGMVKVAGQTPINAVANYLNTAHPAEHRAMHTTDGWSDCRSFFVAGGVLLPQQAPTVCADPERPPSLASKGTLEEWRTGVAQRCKSNPSLNWATSLPFAACLLPFVDIPLNAMGGFHIFGDSSTGKTTLLRAANSVFGQQVDRPQTWDTTANALEPTASSYNHRLLCLDEMGQARHVGTVMDAAYKLAQGIGKQRMSQSLDLLPPYTFQLFFLSSGENSFENTCREETGKEPYPGQKIRFCDIEWSREISPDIGFDEYLSTSNAIDSYYGTAGAAFIERLAATTDAEREAIRKQYSLELKVLWEGEVSNKFRRVAHRFALCILAAELAREWGILPEKWNARYGPVAVFNAWKSASEELDESVMVAKKLQAFIDRSMATNQMHVYCDGKVLECEHEAGPRVVGYMCSDGKVAHLLPDAFARALDGKSPTTSKRALHRMGILKRDERRKTYGCRMKQLKSRMNSHLLASSTTVVQTIDMGELAKATDPSTEDVDVQRTRGFGLGRNGGAQTVFDVTH